MPYIISEKSDLEIIEVKADGKLTQDTRKEILFESAIALNKTNYTRLLIDVTGTEFDPNEPMTGALILVTYLGQFGFKPRTRMAFLYNEAEMHRKYFENVAQSDGYFLKYFRDRKEAIEWLCKKIV